MVTGMIWFDNDPKKNINDKIKFAIQFYKRKFGNEPTICSINPKFKELLFFTDSELNVEYNLNISPDHIWLGIR